MEVITQQNNTGRLTRKFVRSGIAGNYEVIFEMIRVTRNSTNYDIGIERLAKNLIENKGYDSYTPAENQLQTIYNFVHSNVEYVLDKAGLIESIKDARTTLSDGYGDCDDHAILNATLVGCLGFEDVKIAMTRYDENETSFSHVYCVVYDKGKRYVMDTTLPHGKVGDEVRAVEVKEVPVFDNVQGLDGISGLFNNARYYTKKLGRVGIEALPTVAEYLPLGFIPSKAFATGAALINHTATDTLSLNATGSRINQALDNIIIQLTRSAIALDLAQSMALQLYSQLGAIKRTPDDLQVFQTVKQSIKTKLDFIGNFESYAEEHGIKVVYLDSRMMLIAGVAGAGIGVYTLYKAIKGR